jgi:hypothetical protein
LLLFLLLLSERVVFPALERHADIISAGVSSCRRPPRSQACRRLAEVNAVARTKIDAVLVNTRADALGVRKIALLNAHQSSRHLGRRFSVQTVRPIGERAASGSVQAFAHSTIPDGNTYDTIVKRRLHGDVKGEERFVALNACDGAAVLTAPLGALGKQADTVTGANVGKRHQPAPFAMTVGVGGRGDVG